jgi:acyl-CoA hydrolase
MAPTTPSPAAPGLIVMADGPNGPLPDPAAVAALAGVEEPQVLLGWSVRVPAPDWLQTTAAPVATVLTGPATRSVVASGHVRAVPMRLSAVPRLLAGRLRPAVAVVGAHKDGRGWRLAGSPGYAMVAARHAAAVVIERWDGPAPAGAPSLPDVAGRLAGVVDRTDPPDPPPANRPGPQHRRIGELVADLVPDGSTIQWGPGAIGASAVAAMAVRGRRVRVRSGLVTDELVGLQRAGLLIGRAEAAYVWGGSDLMALASGNQPHLQLVEVEHSHDLTAISAIERFVAINTALEVGLDGAVNVEQVGGRIVAGPGGHPDFCAGASRSPGGLSVIGLPSVARGRSTIVARPEVVSTPRTDIDVIVTEHGVADLRGADPATRAARLIAVAAPEHRESLAREAATRAS